MTRKFDIENYKSEVVGYSESSDISYMQYQVAITFKNEVGYKAAICERSIDKFMDNLKDKLDDVVNESWNKIIKTN